eukprot:TRINITY_DN6398_c0_g3_i2.p1 TRINITY_DN6398_c0_g3~~TRINITY_DN6398_c0_g3_i2.p1  ORF type:complete len:690 (+),score=71.28 TRINITY_DN6398_c0_g3_i2:81-2072(+)
MEVSRDVVLVEIRAAPPPPAPIFCWAAWVTPPAAEGCTPGALAQLLLKQAPQALLAAVPRIRRAEVPLPGQRPGWAPVLMSTPLPHGCRSLRLCADLAPPPEQWDEGALPLPGRRRLPSAPVSLFLCIPPLLCAGAAAAAARAASGRTTARTPRSSPAELTGAVSPRAAPPPDVSHNSSGGRNADPPAPAPGCSDGSTLPNALVSGRLVPAACSPRGSVVPAYLSNRAEDEKGALSAAGRWTSAPTGPQGFFNTTPWQNRWCSEEALKGLCARGLFACTRISAGCSPPCPADAAPEATAGAHAADALGGLSGERVLLLGDSQMRGLFVAMVLWLDTAELAAPLTPPTLPGNAEALCSQWAASRASACWVRLGSPPPQPGESVPPTGPTGYPHGPEAMRQLQAAVAGFAATIIVVGASSHYVSRGGLSARFQRDFSALAAAAAAAARPGTLVLLREPLPTGFPLTPNGLWPYASFSEGGRAPRLKDIVARAEQRAKLREHTRILQGGALLERPFQAGQRRPREHSARGGPPAALEPHLTPQDKWDWEFQERPCSVGPLLTRGGGAALRRAFAGAIGSLCATGAGWRVRVLRVWSAAAEAIKGGWDAWLTGPFPYAPHLRKRPWPPDCVHLRCHAVHRMAVALIAAAARGHRCAAGDDCGPPSPR